MSRNLLVNSVRQIGLSVGMVCTLTSLVSAGVLTQAASRERFGVKPFEYFFIEAEDFDSNDVNLGESWILSSHEDALAITIKDPEEPDPGAFASGGESITNVYENTTVNDNQGGEHDVQYKLQFDKAGQYYLYIRQHSPLGPEGNRNQNDSFYYPIEFGENPVQNKANGDDYGLLESTHIPNDRSTRGPWVWFAARDFVDGAEADVPIDQDPGTFQTYTITPAMVGQELIFWMDHRETGTMLDAYLFIERNSGLPPTNGEGPDGEGFFGPGDAVDAEFGLLNLGVEVGGMPGDYDGDEMLTAADINTLAQAIRDGATDAKYDLNNDMLVNLADHTAWVKDPQLKNTYIGDANLDGEFTSTDFVETFLAGKYESGQPAGWEEGDWTGDNAFGSGDFVAAFLDGGYELGPRQAVSAVPEPASLVMVAMGLICLGALRRR